MKEMSRRHSIRLGTAAVMGAGVATPRADGGPLENRALQEPRRYLTPGEDFGDVSRGDPIPHMLEGEALINARLTPETWSLDIEAEGKAQIERPLRRADGNAIDLPTLMKLGESKGVLFLKAMQCTNIAYPLGQGLWEGVPLRDVLRLAGRMKDVRRVYYWGFHNDKPEQMFRSSLAINQVLDTPPGELPPFVAYRLNGEPIPLERGGPVRLVVPWAHGFKSIKWLQHIVLTNDYQANDTYALQNNDPESYLKTAAYIDDDETEAKFAAEQSVTIGGTAMVGWPGLARVEYWLRPAPENAPDTKLAADDPAWTSAEWRPCELEGPPTNLAAELPAGTNSGRIWGFGPDGRPTQWPMRFSLVRWTAVAGRLKPGAYELRARTVDGNGFAQPEPRPFAQRSGLNSVQVKRVVVT